MKCGLISPQEKHASPVDLAKHKTSEESQTAFWERCWSFLLPKPPLAQGQLLV